MDLRWRPRLGTMPRTAAAWRRFNRTFALVFAAAAIVVFSLVFLVDPLGVVPFSLPIDRPLVDIRQRHFYPMVVRSGRYDSLVLGTSTARLLDPDALDRALGGAFANLALNDGRVFEQWKLADLHLRTNGMPRMLIFGLDGVWCDPQADAPDRRITMRGFPEWIYDDNRWNDLAHLLNGRTVEFAIRTLATMAGLREKRLADNGYGVFVPDENEYDLARARQHIWGGEPRPRPAIEPPFTLDPAQEASLATPALDWLVDLIERTRGATEIVLFWTPVHVRSQPQAGSREAAVEEVCKRRIDAVAAKAGVPVIDWRIPSPLTREDANYWDSLHYRLPVADRIIDSIVRVRRGASGDPGGNWVLRVPPGQ